MKKLDHLVVMSIAKVAQAAIRAHCECYGDRTHPKWIDLDNEAKGHYARGVDLVYQNQRLAAEDLHDFWVMDHLIMGWTHGEKKDKILKKHPCLVPFEQLSEYEKSKDRLFIEVVRALLPTENE